MINILSGEFILRFRPNGGTAVLLRSIFISTMVYLLAIGLKSALRDGATLAFDFRAARLLISDTIPWFGAIFAGVYAALYARFASQWTYLANLYNDQMAAAVQSPPADNQNTAILRMWQAGFIEDAETLHLATKPMFASVIASLLEKKGVKEAYIASVKDGPARFKALQVQIDKVLASM